MSGSRVNHSFRVLRFQARALIGPLFLPVTSIRGFLLLTGEQQCAHIVPLNLVTGAPPQIIIFTLTLIMALITTTPASHFRKQKQMLTNAVLLPDIKVDIVLTYHINYIRQLYYVQNNNADHVVIIP